jgi:hypothetical protein
MRALGAGLGPGAPGHCCSHAVPLCLAKLFHMVYQPGLHLVTLVQLPASHVTDQTGAQRREVTCSRVYDSKSWARTQAPGEISDMVTLLL